MFQCSHPNCHRNRSPPHTPRIAVYTSRSHIETASGNKRLKRKTELQKLINVELLRLTRVIDSVYSGRFYSVEHLIKLYGLIAAKNPNNIE